MATTPEQRAQRAFEEATLKRFAEQHLSPGHLKLIQEIREAEKRTLRENDDKFRAEYKTRCVQEEKRLRDERASPDFSLHMLGRDKLNQNSMSVQARLNVNSMHGRTMEAIRQDARGKEKEVINDADKAKEYKDFCKQGLNRARGKEYDREHERPRDRD